MLPGMSCLQADACVDESTTSITKQLDHDEHETEDCGAFCTCSCCVHIVSVNYQSPEFELEETLLCDGNTFFDNDIYIPSNCLGNIWQPPKIS